MSYYTEIVEGGIIIPKESQEKIFKIWHDLNWANFMHTAPPNYISHECRDTQDYLRALGFEFRVLNNGDILIDIYKGYIDDEDVFFAAAAPFIPCGNYVVWECDDENYVWGFDGKTMIEVSSLEEALEHMRATNDKALLEGIIEPNVNLKNASAFKL